MSEQLTYEWGGGESPLPGLTKVGVIYRGDYHDEGYAQEFDWFHVDPAHPLTEADDSEFDIVNYYIIEEPSNDWIVWEGGENPVPDQKVEVIFRGFTYVYEDDSDVFEWTHIPDDHSVDIVLYRVVSKLPEGWF